MKQSVLFLAMVIGLSSAYSQEEVIEVTAGEQEVVAQELEKESNNQAHDKKTKKMLKKLAKFFKESPAKVAVEVKKLDDCVSCENKTKSEIVITNIGRKLGRGSAWLSTTTAKPFMQAAGFVTGALEKKEKNQDIVALYKFFLNHSEEFDELYKEAGTVTDMAELMLAQVREITEKKTRIILKDSLKELGLDREIPEDLADYELTEEEIASLDLSKLTPDLINKHPEYAELLPIIGEVKKEELLDIITLGYVDREISFDNYTAALPKIHEAALTISGQLFAPKIALGVISKSLGGLYMAPVIAADIGTGVSAAICLSAETKAKFEKDSDLRSFCSYVVNRSAYELQKSKAKGYVAGKSFRAKMEEKAKERKKRRTERREKREARRAQLG